MVSCHLLLNSSLIASTADPDYTYLSAQCNFLLLLNFFTTIHITTWSTLQLEAYKDESIHVPTLHFILGKDVHEDLQKAKDGPEFVRVITTEAERKRLLTAAHEGLGSTLESQALGGHFGRDKTVWKLIDTQVWWPPLRQDFKCIFMLSSITVTPSLGIITLSLSIISLIYRQVIKNKDFRFPKVISNFRK